MASSDIQAYEEMISELNSFISNVNASCAALNSAGQDCIDNMNQDSNSQRIAQSLQAKVSAIQSTTETAEALAKELQRELDDILDTETISFDD